MREPTTTFWVAEVHARGEAILPAVYWCGLAYPLAPTTTDIRAAARFNTRDDALREMAKAFPIKGCYLYAAEHEFQGDLPSERREIDKIRARELFQRCRNIRTQAGLTQAQVAEAAGKSRVMYTHEELGTAGAGQSVRNAIYWLSLVEMLAKGAAK